MPWRAAQLAVLLNVLDGVPLTESERRTVVWLASRPASTVENLAELIHK